MKQINRTFGFRDDWQSGRRRAWILFLVPAIVIYTVFMACPLINSMILSFYTGEGLIPDIFVGLKNYQTLFSDTIWNERFMNALGNTFIFFGIHMLVQNTLGLLFATLLSQKKLPGKNIYRTIIFMPATMSVLLTAFLWRLLLNPRWGMVKALLEAVGLGGLFSAWLGDTNTALIVVSLVSSWQWVGLPTMMFLAGFLGISEELVEAAKVDGANAWQIWFRIKLPLLMPVISIVSILTFIGNFNAFDVVYAMMGANGTPSYSTDLLGTFFYRVAVAGEHPVANADKGIGATVATLTFMILMTGVLGWLWFSRRNSQEERLG